MEQRATPEVNLERRDKETEGRLAGVDTKKTKGKRTKPKYQVQALPKEKGWTGR